MREYQLDRWSTINYLGNRVGQRMVLAHITMVKLQLKVGIDAPICWYNTSSNFIHALFNILSLLLWIMFYVAFSLLQVQYRISISYLLLLGLISCGEEIMYNSWICIGGRVYPPRITALMTLLDVTSAYNGRRDWIHSLGGCMMKSNVWIGIWLTSRRININSPCPPLPL